MEIKKVLVLGASGDQGIPLISALLETKLDVIAGVRREDAMQGTPYPNLATVTADINDVVSLESAFEQVDALAMHLPFEHDVQLATSFGHNIVTAAKAAGLKKIVFNTSCYVAGQDLGLGGHDGRRRIEQTIRESGLDYVILRPVVFMDNAIRVWIKPAIMSKDLFVYPASEKLKISWIALEDVGRLMACAITSPDVSRETITVGGPEALTGHEVAARISQAANREISFKSIQPQEFAENMSEMVTGSREIPEGSVYHGMSLFYTWYNEQPVSPLAVDPASFLDRLPVQLTDYASWASKQDWS